MVPGCQLGRKAKSHHWRIEMKYDDASWHSDGNYPPELPIQNASTHIGIYLAWAIDNDFVSELHLEEHPQEVALVKHRKIKGSEFLGKFCDGKLTDEDFNDLGKDFTESFFEDRYYEVYANAVDPDDQLPTIYHVCDSWDTYDKVSPLISDAFKKWKSNNRMDEYLLRRNSRSIFDSLQFRFSQSSLGSGLSWPKKS